jgi:hypothetical protein
MSHPTRPIRRRRIGVLAATAAAAATLTACGGQAATTTNGASSTNQPAGAGATGGAGGNGAFGQVAAISGTTLQVQDPRNGQTAVTYTASTTFRQTVTVSRTALKVGDCVAVQPPSTTGTIPAGSTVTAGSVTITTSTANGCSRPGGTGAAGGGFRGGNGSQPSARPTAGAGRGFGGGGAFGQVTAVTATGFNVKGARPPTAAATSTSTVDAVTTTTSTTYAETVSARSSAVKVGFCVAAVGAADSTATIKATSITVSQPGPNGCSGFGGRFGAGAGSAGAGG